MAEESPWIVWWRRDAASSTTLFCLPNAGAGASPFRTWPEAVPDGIDLAALRLPGRESRIAEPPIADLRELAAAVAEALAPSLRPPYAFFGHCSGAWLAFELARQLRRESLPLPARIVVAAQAGPSLKTETSSLSDQDPRERLRALGGTDPAVLAHDELFELLRPAIEADFRLTDDYLYVPEPPFDFPISVIAGTQDAGLWADGLGAWQAETTRELDVRLLPGDHFFAGSDWDRLAQEAGDAALASVPPPRR